MRISEKLRWFVALIFNLILCLGAMYLIWGWLTIGDIKAKCIKEGVNFEEVMESLIASGPTIIQERNATNSSQIHLNWGPAKYPAFRRYAVSISSSDFEFETTNVLQGGVSHPQSRTSSYNIFDGGFIEPFTVLTENTLNFVFVMGLAYVMSMSLLAVKSLKAFNFGLKYFVLRPLAGAIVGGCLFLFILSGGKVFIDSASPINGSALGIIAAMASVYCERFESWLRKLTTNVGPTEEDQEDGGRVQ